MISPERLDAMQGQWVRLVAAFGVAPAEAYPPFDRLVAAYTAPDRHYHNLEHLGEMFRVAGRLAAHTRAPLAVQLAVWYHDAVYDPRAKDNEGRSAALAGEELVALGVPTATVGAVQRLVLATAHLLGEELPAAPDAAVIIDSDLAILGAADARYRRYAADVRREYAFVPDPDYRAGRAAVLRQFLARSRIYRHDVLFEEGEARARENMTAELRDLET